MIKTWWTRVKAYLDTLKKKKNSISAKPVCPLIPPFLVCLTDFIQYIESGFEF